MSLQLAAEHLKTHGRGEDTELVHMTPGELKGLQQLAEAHGGSLTINPTTGLPEAGFLSNLLPTVLGVGVGIATGNPFIGAAVAGGLGYAQSGSLMSGLSSGLGAWSGMNLVNGLAAAGSTPLTTAGAVPETTSGVVESAVPASGVPLTTAESASPYWTTGQAGSQAGVAGAVGADASTLATQVPQAVANGAYPNFAGNAVTGATAAEDVGSQLAKEQLAAANAGLSPTSMNGVNSLYPSGSQVSGYTGNPYSPSDYLKYQKGLGMDSMGNLTNTLSNAGQGVSNLVSDPSKAWDFAMANKGTVLGAGMGLLGAMPKPKLPTPAGYQPDAYDKRLAAYKLDPSFQGSFPAQPTPAYQASYTDYTRNPYVPGYADGGIAALANGGQGVGAQGMGNAQSYPGARLDMTQYATPSQMPTSSSVINSGYEMQTNPYTGEPNGMAEGGIASYSGTSGSKVSEMTPQQIDSITNFAVMKDSDPNTRDADAWTAAQYRIGKLGKRFGIAPPTQPTPMVKGIGDVAPAEFAAGGSTGYSLGSYAAGGNPRLLKGPGDGMSDNIPAVIGGKQPARLADGEFVVPADVVSHLGNGSTDAGAKHLYNMMDRVRKARTGNKKQGKQINPNKFLPT
jgi:hypothetical protein